MAEFHKKPYRLLRYVMTMLLMGMMFTGVTYGMHDTKEVINEFKNPTLDVSKVWRPAEGHPESVQVQLYQNGVAYDLVVLNADNNWSHSWQGLDSDYIWTVDEPNVPNGYDKTITGNAEEGYVITNSKDIPVDPDISVSVTKVWQPAQGHPESVTVQLYRDGIAEGSPLVLDSANNWTHTWKNLNKNNAWTVNELDVPEGYTKTISGNETSGYVITNTKDNGKTDPPEDKIDDPDSPTGGREPIPEPEIDPNFNIGDGDVPEGGKDYVPGNVPKTSDDADPRPWLIILAVSTLILRRQLFFKKTKRTLY